MEQMCLQNNIHIRKVYNGPLNSQNTPPIDHSGSVFLKVLKTQHKKRSTSLATRPVMPDFVDTL